MKLATSILLAAMTVFATTAGAATPKPPTFKALDADGNGGVDAAEFAKATESGVKQKFAKLDKNGDGKLTRGEYAVVLGDEDCE